MATLSIDAVYGARKDKEPGRQLTLDALPAFRPGVSPGLYRDPNSQERIRVNPDGSMDFLDTSGAVDNPKKVVLDPATGRLTETAADLRSPGAVPKVAKPAAVRAAAKSGDTVPLDAIYGKPKPAEPIVGPMTPVAGDPRLERLGNVLVPPEQPGPGPGAPGPQNYGPISPSRRDYIMLREGWFNSLLGSTVADIQRNARSDPERLKNEFPAFPGRKLPRGLEEIKRTNPERFAEIRSRLQSSWDLMTPEQRAETEAAFRRDSTAFREKRDLHRDEIRRAGPAEGWQQEVTDFIANMLGASLSPESLIGPGVTSGVRTGLRAGIQRAIRAAAVNAGVEAAVDPIVQKAAVGRGDQKEFSLQQFGISVLGGAVLGAGIRGGIDAAKSIRNTLRESVAKKVGKPAAEVTPDDLTPDVVADPEVRAVLEQSQVMLRSGEEVADATAPAPPTRAPGKPDAPGPAVRAPDKPDIKTGRPAPAEPTVRPKTEMPPAPPLRAPDRPDAPGPAVTPEKRFSRVTQESTIKPEPIRLRGDDIDADLRVPDAPAARTDVKPADARGAERTARFFDEEAKTTAARDQADAIKRLEEDWKARSESSEVRASIEGAAKLYRDSKVKFSNTPEAPGADRRYRTDTHGFVASDRGGPTVFKTPRQAANWIVNTGHRTSPDQVFEVTTHPVRPGGYSVRERQRNAADGRTRTAEEGPDPGAAPAKRGALRLQGQSKAAPAPSPRLVKAVEPVTKAADAPPIRLRGAKETPKAESRGDQSKVDDRPASRTEPPKQGDHPEPEAVKDADPKSRDFKDWFRGSKIVDEKGAPRVVYHGSRDSFDDFRAERRPGVGGIYFTTKPFHADLYATGEGANVRPVYLDIKNPKIIDKPGERRGSFSLTNDEIADLKAQGYDGIVNKPGNEIVAFDPGQVRSSIADRFDIRDGADPKVTDAETRTHATFYSNPIMDPEVWKQTRALLVETYGWSKEQYKAWEDDAKAYFEPLAKGVRAAKDEHSKWELIRRAFHSETARVLGWSNDGVLRTLAAKYRAPTINTLADKFSALSGSGKAVDRTYHEGMRVRLGHNFSALDAIEKDLAAAVGYSKRNNKARIETWQKVAKLVETAPTIRPGTPVNDAAIAVRKLLQDELAYRKKAGLEHGEIERYMPHSFEPTAVLNDGIAFQRDVAAQYVRLGASQKEADAQATALYENFLYGEHGFKPGDRDFVHLGVAGSRPKSEKSRSFDQAAYTALRKYYVQDPLESLIHYFESSAKRAEWVRIMGPDMEKWKEYKQKIIDEGAVEAIPSIVKSIESSVGAMPRIQSRSLRAGLSMAQTTSNLAYLAHAVPSSLSEPALAAMATGRVRDALTAYAKTLQQWTLGLRRMPAAQRERELAEMTGIVMDLGREMAWENRVGGQVEGKWGRNVNRAYFTGTGLHQFTRSTGIAFRSIGDKFLMREAKRFLEGGALRRSAAYLLRDLGVADADMPGFAKWLANRDGRITSDDIATGGPQVETYLTAINRFVNRTRIAPTGSDRPRLANNPFGRVVYSLASFLSTFGKEVTWREIRKVRAALNPHEDLGALDRLRFMKMTAMAALPILAQRAIGELRDEYTEIGEDSADRNARKPRTEADKWMLALSRAGFQGMADIPVNLITSVKYKRDPATALVGPVFGLVSEAIKAAVNYSDPEANSPNTNTAERYLAKVMYDLAIKPIIAAAGGALPLPARTPLLYGTGHRQTRNKFVTEMAGPPKDKRPRNPNIPAPPRPPKPPLPLRP